MHTWDKWGDDSGGCDTLWRMNGRNTLTVYLSGVAQQTPMSFSMGHLNGLQNEYFILFLKAYDEFIILQYTDANSKKTFLRKYELKLY